MTVNGSRSVTQSGRSITAESSVACLASPGRGSTMPEFTSEYSTTVSVVLGHSKRAQEDFGQGYAILGPLLDTDRRPGAR